MNRRHVMTSLTGFAALAAVEPTVFAAESSPARTSYLPILDPRQMGATGDGKTLDSEIISPISREAKRSRLKDWNSMQRIPPSITLSVTRQVGTQTRMT